MIPSSSRLLRATLPIWACAAAIVMCASSATGASAEEPDFVVPANEGYGISECMKPGQDCGRIIADSWCEAHGHGHATAFGLTEDVTGATKVSTAVAQQMPPGSVLIRCGE